jgi:hypothetical protein
MGKVRRVRVCLPEWLIESVRRRVGKGEFSQYVADALEWRLELDLLTERSEMMKAEAAPVPEEFRAEAAAAWPDAN